MRHSHLLCRTRFHCYIAEKQLKKQKLNNFKHETLLDLEHSWVTTQIKVKLCPSSVHGETSNFTGKTVASTEASLLHHPQSSCPMSHPCCSPRRIWFLRIENDADTWLFGFPCFIMLSCFHAATKAAGDLPFCRVDV